VTATGTVVATGHVTTGIVIMVAMAAVTMAAAVITTMVTGIKLYSACF
jgi:hypothetical protein